MDIKKILKDSAPRNHVKLYEDAKNAMDLERQMAKEENRPPRGLSTILKLLLHADSGLPESERQYSISSPFGAITALRAIDPDFVAHNTRNYTKKK